MTAAKPILHISSGPHTRSRLGMSNVMEQVLLSLMPVTVIGVINFGSYALLVILTSIAAAVVTEYLFDRITGKPNTAKDLSAVVTGLLLALCLPSHVPLYIPLLGAVFAILVAKSFFGGLGKNFMNPALAGRCFLLASFGTTMTQYTFDGVTGATPLADFANGNSVSILNLFIGHTNGVIGCSALGLLLGAVLLFAFHAITWEIPAATLGGFVLFILLFGGHGFDPSYLALQLFGGGILMAAFFMATDPVTSPVTRPGQIIFGFTVGILTGLFRLRGASADSTSYAVIISNLIVPILDTYVVPKPYAYRKHAKTKPDTDDGKRKEKFHGIPRPAMVLTVITLIAGFLLGTVYHVTKANIAAQELARKEASYRDVLSGAATFEDEKKYTKAASSYNGSAFGKVAIDSVVTGKTKGGKTAGYVISVTDSDGFNGDISFAVGIRPDGTVTGISFTTLAETAGMGMKADEPAFKDQFDNRKVSKFILNKQGGSKKDDEIDSISGASITSGAVVNGVNAALDFYEKNIR